MSTQTVLRWGRSAYESDAHLAAERASAEALGLRWLVRPDRAPPAELAEADALVVTSGVRVDDAVLERLRGDLVLTTTSGYDHIDVGAAQRRSIAVGRCPLARRDAVVESALASMLSLLQARPVLQERALAGVWARGELEALAPRTLAGARVVVVGLGVIGQRMVSVLDALGAEVVGVDPVSHPANMRIEAMEAALVGADAVTLHCALTPSSRGLLDATALDRLPRGAVVVNTARGRVLNLDAAIERLRAGHLGGLAVDVFPEEPFPRLAELAATPNALLTPHGAGYSTRLGALVALEVTATLRAWTTGSSIPHAVR